MSSRSARRRRAKTRKQDELLRKTVKDLGKGRITSIAESVWSEFKHHGAYWEYWNPTQSGPNLRREDD